VLHDLASVELGPDRRQLLGGLELGDTLLELVHPTRERARLAFVARRAVAPGEHVELGQEGSGVAHVATHRSVGPTEAVGVEPEVQRHQLGDGLDVVVRVPQRLQPLAGHPRAHRVVVVERGALAGLEPPGAGLADVVEQRGQPGDAEVERRVVQVRRRFGSAHVLDDREGVGEHVLVTVDRIVLESHRGQLGQELLGEAGVDEEPQAGGGVVDRDELVELVADAFGRHDLEPRCQLAHGGDEAVLGLHLVRRDEACGTQHP
jgi:hypothetical protein